MTEHSKEALRKGFSENLGTLIFASQYVPITLEHIFDATRARYPDCELGDWYGNVYDKNSVTKNEPEPNTRRFGTALRFGDARYAVIIHANQPPRPESLDLGPYPHIFWPSAAEDVHKATAHAMILVTDNVNTPAKSPAEAVKKARAMTLLTAVVASLVPAIGVLSVLGANAIETKFYSTMADACYNDPLMGMAIWVRLVFLEAAQPEGAEHAFTIGLNDFGFPECEYVDLSPGRNAIWTHSCTVAQNLIRIGHRLENGEKFPLSRAVRPQLSSGKKIKTASLASDVSYDGRECGDIQAGPHLA
jgi:hypothetical protein